MECSSVALSAIQELEKQGFRAYLVGGCVRDSLLGLIPHDWDICTNASPQQMLSVFSHKRCIPTGLQHGTVTVLWDEIPLEITTFRTEAGYSDGRHPDAVTFVDTLEADLSRRDFTVNAMAYHPFDGVIDPFGGQQDLADKVLRCVGDPGRRFTEDGLRIIRALRFAARFGLRMESLTTQALLEHAPRLEVVAAERVREELDRLLTAPHVGEVLTEFWQVLLPVLPELKAMEGFEQHSRYHTLTVLDHTLLAVAQSEPDRIIRLTLLLHDIGKPFCFTRDEMGEGHFYGHPKKSMDMAKEILRRLRYDRRTTERVLLLIKYHDTVIEQTETAVTRWLNRLGEEGLRQLLAVKKGDCMGHASSLIPERLQELERLHHLLDEILARRQCFSLKGLAVNGDDVMALGVPAGKMVGEALNWMLNAVMEQQLPNEKESLLQAYTASHPL